MQGSERATKRPFEVGPSHDVPKLSRHPTPVASTITTSQSFTVHHAQSLKMVSLLVVVFVVEVVVHVINLIGAAAINNLVRCKISDPNSLAWLTCVVRIAMDCD